MSGWFEYWREDYPTRSEDPVSLTNMNVERFFSLKDRDWTQRAIHSNICMAGRWFLVNRDKLRKRGRGIFVEPDFCSSYSVSIAMATMAYFAACRTAHFGGTYYLNVAEVISKRFRVESTLLSHADQVFLEFPSQVSPNHYDEVVQLVRQAHGTVFVYFSSTPSAHFKNKLFMDIGGRQTFTIFDADKQRETELYMKVEARRQGRKDPADIWREE